MNHSSPVNPVPRAKLALSVHLIVRDSAKAMAFYSQVFGATELYRLVEPGNPKKIGHAEMRFGDVTLALADEYPDFGALSPITVGGSPVMMHLYVEDVDATLRRAEEAGAIIVRPAKNEFHGDRVGIITDPFGHKWMLASHIEDVTPAEMQNRWNGGAA